MHNFLILGGGPAGLSFANYLLNRGETSFLILEKEDSAGGLCKSLTVDESPLDTGGGHILDVKRPDVLHFLFQFMPETEWNKFNRISRIHLRDGLEINYPFEANIWQLPKKDQTAHLTAISEAGCNNLVPKPDRFKEWITWKLGERIAQDYMLPYNEKIWSQDLNKLGTYWLEKLPEISFQETLYSCQEHKPFGTLPGHAEFYYPKQFGFGELWNRMAERIKDRIVYGTPLNQLNIESHTVNNIYRGTHIINTIPWCEFKIMSHVPHSVLDAVSQLEYSSVAVKYYDNTPETTSHWTYFPDRQLEHHRALYRSNFCIGSKGYWTEINTRRLIKDHHPTYINNYAYPLNTITKPQAIQRILSWMEVNKIYGLGRWGEWEHFNSDVVVERALKLAETLLTGSSKRF